VNLFLLSLGWELQVWTILKQSNNGFFISTKRVFGVEVIPDAIEDAKFNAKRNGLDKKTHLEVGRVENVIPFWYNTTPKFNPDVLVVDPPINNDEVNFLDDIDYQYILPTPLPNITPK
jgi:23S rRNA G2445 N2-methylase RlmL